MGVSMPMEKVEMFWGRKYTYLGESVVRNKFIEKKVKRVKENINHLLFLNWVKFIAITGSVASEKQQNVAIQVHYGD